MQLLKSNQNIHMYVNIGTYIHIHLLYNIMQSHMKPYNSDQTQKWYTAKYNAHIFKLEFRSFRTCVAQSFGWFFDA